MTSTAFAASCFPACSPPVDDKKYSFSENGSSGKNAHSVSHRGHKVRTNAQVNYKTDGAVIDLPKHERMKIEDDTPPPRTFINQLPDWSVLLAAITTVFLAAEKQWMMLDWKPKRPDMLIDPFGLGRIVQDSLIFRQNFSVRSYEIGPDRNASIESLMNHLQETALNHVKTVGLLGDGFGSTPEMCKRNLIWVVSRMQVIVDRYPTWGDVVQVDTWVDRSRKNGMRRDWLVRDTTTSETLMRASSVWVMMNKQTRKLSRIPEEVRRELGPYFLNSAPVVEEDTRKLRDVDECSTNYVRKGLTAKWNDLDVNQHVNNVKYIGWILESAPQSVLESHKLQALTLEYRRECGRGSMVKSITEVDHLANDGGVECHHMLCLEDGAVIMRARTRWRPKC